jgi:hypothetical protein
MGRFHVTGDHSRARSFHLPSHGASHRGTFGRLRTQAARSGERPLRIRRRERVISPIKELGRTFQSRREPLVRDPELESPAPSGRMPDLTRIYQN